MAEMRGKRGEKTQFSITCGLLRQYLKEKGSFGSIGLDIMAPRPLHHQHHGRYQSPTTLSLLPGVDVSTEDHTNDGTHQTAPKSMELFPQHAAGFGSSVLPLKEESVKTASSIKHTEKSSQLTIFYGGKVLVFDDFPADKAMDLLQIASKESTVAPKRGLPVPSSTNAAESSTQNDLPKPTQANASDMPIARKNSLHRFLEKRKDRISTKAPYQAHGGSSAAAPPDEVKLEDGQPWLGLGRHAVKQEHSSGSSR